MIMIIFMMERRISVTIVMIKLLEFFMLEEYGSNAVTNPISWWRPLLHPQELGIGQKSGELVH